MEVEEVFKGVPDLSWTADFLRDTFVANGDCSLDSYRESSEESEILVFLGCSKSRLSSGRHGHEF